MQPPAPVKPRTLALLETAGWRVASAEAKAALEKAVERLKAAGVNVIGRSSHAEVAAVEEAIADAASISTRANDWEWRWPLNSFHHRDADKLSRIMLDRMARSANMRPDDYRAALAERAQARAVYARLAAICDGSLTLTAPAAAPLGLETTGNPIFAVPFSMLGVPAISLPLLREQNLPLGLQITGFGGQDAAAIGIAAWLVQTLGGER